MKKLLGKEICPDWNHSILRYSCQYVILFWYLSNTASIARGLNTIYTILTPIVYAAAISYVLWPVIRIMERSVVYRICEKKNWNPTHKVRHAIRMICVIITLLLFFTGYLWFVICAEPGTDSTVSQTLSTICQR